MHHYCATFNGSGGRVDLLATLQRYPFHELSPDSSIVMPGSTWHPSPSCRTPIRHPPPLRHAGLDPASRGIKKKAKALDPRLKMSGMTNGDLRRNDGRGHLGMTKWACAGMTIGSVHGNDGRGHLGMTTRSAGMTEGGLLANDGAGVTRRDAPNRGPAVRRATVRLLSGFRV